MAEFKIYCDGREQHRISARDESEALEKWLDLMCFESLEQAAEEYFCSPEDIEAKKLVRL